MRIQARHILLLTLILPALPAQVIKHYHVDANIGSDTNPGTRSSPFLSITKAVSVAVKDAVIHVRPGTYSQAATGESFTIGIGTGAATHSNIKILGSDPAACILEFGSAAATSAYYFQIWNGATKIEIANLTMQNGSATPWYTAAIGLNCDGLHLHHCIIRNCTSGIIAWGNSRNTNIHDNILDGCGVAIRLRGGRRAVNNLLHHNLVLGNTGYHAISMSGNDASQVVVNNIIVGSSGIAFDLGTPPGGVVFESNCAHQNITDYNSTTTISRSNLTTDPQFLDPSKGDYRLKLTSPCVETGYRAQALVVNDFYGNARVSDFDDDFRAVPDIGIHEIEGLSLTVANWGQGQTATFSLTSPSTLLLSHLYLSLRSAPVAINPFGLIGIDLSPGISYLIGLPAVPGSVKLTIPTAPALNDLPIWFQAFGITSTLTFKPSGRLDQIL
ncbi:MAG: DUF1565 domain-containing protein [Planctomycetota bacterium]|nr:DUF1565 domain-containing protein [Planctomycetota bacterium]